MKQLWRNLKEHCALLLRGYRLILQIGKGKELFFHGAGAAVTAIAPLVTLYFSGQIIDELSGAKDGRRLLVLAALTVGVNLALLLLKNLLNRKKEAATATSWDDAYMTYARKMLSMDYEHVEDVRVHERLDQIKQMQNWSGHGLFKLIQVVDGLVEGFVGAVSSFVLAIGLLLVTVKNPAGPAEVLASHWGTALLLALLLLSLVVFYFLSKLDAKRLDDMSKDMTLTNRLFSYFYWTLPSDHKGGKDIRLYGETELIHREMKEATEEDHRFANQIARWFGPTAALSAAVPYVMSLFVYLVVAAKAYLGLIGIGGVVTYVGAVNRFSAGCQKLFDALSDLMANHASLKNVFEFLELHNDRYNGTLPTEKRNDGEYLIEFHDVSFRYPNTEAYALRHLNLKLKIGERLAVVGRNGSGKTTMIKLLCRLYDPTEGVITLNGIDIQKYNYREYLDLFSVVFQDFHLFSFELGQSVAASMEYDEQRVRDCLREAGMEERLSKMPHGLATYLNKDFEEEGVEVSGGEAQKLAIARALYKDAPFLVLDEPTAALDPVAEYEVYRKFAKIARNKTSVCISHRLSSCRFCDRIAVFQQGELVQMGSHESLLQEETGVYRALWDAQAQYYAPEEREALDRTPAEC